MGMVRVTMLVTYIAISGVAMAADNVKVDVCHIPPTDAQRLHTLTIAESALPAHLDHGDVEGTCGDNCETLCDDGNACTVDCYPDAFDGCLTQPRPDVDCALPGTVDWCDPADGCHNVESACDDGQDNDGDGLADYFDTDCTDVCDPFDTPLCPSTEDQEIRAETPTKYQVFGAGVDMSGDVAIVGGRDEAHILRYDGNAWAIEDRLTPSDGATDSFGAFAVAVSGDYAVVGSGMYTTVGAAYVFHYDGTDWVEQAKLVSPNPGSRPSFAEDVDIDGDLAVARQQNNGVAHVYRRTGSSWALEASLAPSMSIAEMSLDVAVSGNAVFVGQRDAAKTHGAVEVWRHTDGEWVPEAVLTAFGEGDSGDRIGSGLSASGDVVVVGNWYAPCADGGGCGAAYIYRYDGTAWVPEARLTEPIGSQYGYFGEGTAISGNTVLIAASKSPEGYPNGAGRAYLYQYDDLLESWTLVTAMMASSPVLGDSFARAAISESRGLIGNPFRCTPEEFCRANSYGAVYAYDFTDFLTP